MAIFKTSGFEPPSTVKVVPPPLSEKIRRIEHGANSGQIVVWIQPVWKASSYELRYAPALAGGAPTTWTTKGIDMVKAPVVVEGLTPATTYVFQARALAKNVFTDWSDATTFICT